MKNILTLATYVILFLTGCSSTHLNLKGALVKVYKFNTTTRQMVCSTENSNKISFIYIGTETIEGNITIEDKEVIAQYVKNVLEETRFINPIAIPALAGEYPDLSIKILQFSIQTKKIGNLIKRRGIFQANFSIRQAGMLECYTAKPVLIEKVFIQPIYREDKLPSITKIKKALIKEATNSVIREFVPVKSTILRPTKSGKGLVKTSAEMINNGNCISAYEILDPIASNPECKEPFILYNMGVALECLAWSNSTDFETQKKYLIEANKYYRKAALLRPQDKDIQKAMAETSYELSVIFSSIESQKNTKDLLNIYQTPTGY